MLAHHLIKDTFLHLLLQSMKLSFQLFSSSIQVEFSICKATKGKPMPPKPPSVPYSQLISNSLHFHILNCKITISNV